MNTLKKSKSRKSLKKLTILAPFWLPPVSPSTPLSRSKTHVPVVVLLSKYKFDAHGEGEMSIEPREYLKLIERPGNGWLKVQKLDAYDHVGYVPASYVDIEVNDPSNPVTVDWLNCTTVNKGTMELSLNLGPSPANEIPRTPVSMDEMPRTPESIVGSPNGSPRYKLDIFKPSITSLESRLLESKHLESNHLESPNVVNGNSSMIDLPRLDLPKRHLSSPKSLVDFPKRHLGSPRSHYGSKDKFSDCRSGEHSMSLSHLGQSQPQLGPSWPLVAGTTAFDRISAVKIDQVLQNKDGIVWYKIQFTIGNKLVFVGKSYHDLYQFHSRLLAEHPTADLPKLPSPFSHHSVGPNPDSRVIEELGTRRKDLERYLARMVKMEVVWTLRLATALLEGPNYLCAASVVPCADDVVNAIDAGSTVLEGSVEETESRSLFLPLDANVKYLSYMYDKIFQGKTTRKTTQTEEKRNQDITHGYGKPNDKGSPSLILGMTKEPIQQKLIQELQGKLDLQLAQVVPSLSCNTLDSYTSLIAGYDSDDDTANTEPESVFSCQRRGGSTTSDGTTTSGDSPGANCSEWERIDEDEGVLQSPKTCSQISPRTRRNSGDKVKIKVLLNNDEGDILALLLKRTNVISIVYLKKLLSYKIYKDANLIEHYDLQRVGCDEVESDDVLMAHIKSADKMVLGVVRKRTRQKEEQEINI